MEEESCRPRVAVSACLLGEAVRYDGRTKGNEWVSQVLTTEVEVVAICPEVEAGMAVPRPPMRCAYDKSGRLRLHLVGDEAPKDDKLGTMIQVFSERRLNDLRDLDGYVFKCRSPSCGVHDAPYFASTLATAPIREFGPGFWAARVLSEFSDLPIVDEEQLATEAAQKSFLEQVRQHTRRRIRRRTDGV